jgi:dTDP-L-rhamnose 4-epimerase
MRVFGREVDWTVSGKFRLGDIRHNYADLTLISERLGYVPKVSFEEGIRRFEKWAVAQGPRASTYEDSLAEMMTRGLMKGAEQ